MEFNRDGSARIGYIVGRLAENAVRFIANNGNDFTLRKLTDLSVEPIGKSGFVKKADDGRNLFYLEPEARL